MFETAFTWFIAIVFSLVGWGSLFHFAWIVRNWPEARGRVVGNRQEYGKAGNVGHHLSRTVVNFAEIEFSALGRNYVVKGGVGRSNPWPMGETISLHYKPTNPKHMLDFNFWQRMSFSGAFIFFGGACALSLAGYIG